MLMEQLTDSAHKTIQWSINYLISQVTSFW